MSDTTIVSSYSLSIESRVILSDIQNDGIVRVELMQGSLHQLSKWLQSNYTIY